MDRLLIIETQESKSINCSNFSSLTAGVEFKKSPVCTQNADLLLKEHSMWNFKSEKKKRTKGLPSSVKLEVAWSLE